MPLFAERGWDAHAVSLRGHGRSEGSYLNASIEDHLEDVRHAVAALGGSPVVVGHSLGGFLIQHLLGERRFPAAVLVAPAPRRYPLRVAARAAVRHPRVMLRDLRSGDLAGIVGTEHLVRDALFTPLTPDPVVAGCAARLTGASMAVFRELFTKPPPGPMPGTPTLVLAASEDRGFSPRLVGRVARRLDADFEVVELSGHEIPLDLEWRRAAETTLLWLQRTLPAMPDAVAA
jgi:pimeloyl-ACP methyl ester carboxylesterase